MALINDSRSNHYCYWFDRTSTARKYCYREFLYRFFFIFFIFGFNNNKFQTIYNWVNAMDGSFLNLEPLMLQRSKNDLHKQYRGLPSDAYCSVYIERFKHFVYKYFKNGL